MSKYRSVQVSFWQDAFVLDLTPEEKYFYIYLMTNSKTNQIGIYELPKRIIEIETGYNRETVEKLLERFVEYEKIYYSEETKEIMLRNWTKYNWNSSPKVVQKAQDDLRKVKNEAFCARYLETLENKGIDTVAIQYGYDIAKEKEKEKEKDKEKDKEKEKDNKRFDAHAQFSEWWEIYNKKKDKPRAEKAFAAVTKKFGYPILVAKTKEYVSGFDDPNDTFKKHPTTFLNSFDPDNDYRQSKKGDNRFGKNRFNSEQDATKAKNEFGLPF